MQELVWGEAIRGHRRDAAPDWRWLHVGETAIFCLVPALFLQFYCGNWPNKFSKPVNILIRTTIVIVGATVVYCLYYKYAHFILGTQKGFSHPQQFPMIPMIWLIDIWLVNWWFMDGWPGWRMKMRSVEEAESAKKAAETDEWHADMGWGLVCGLGAGVVFYFALVWILPICSATFTLVE